MLYHEILVVHQDNELYMDRVYQDDWIRNELYLIQYLKMSELSLELVRMMEEY